MPYSGRGADTSYTAGSEMQLIKAISPSVPYLTSSNDGGCVKAYIYKALNDSNITVTGSWWINLVIVFWLVSKRLNSSSVYYLGTGTSFDVSNIPGYQNLTKDNFIVCACSLSGSGTGGYYFNSVTESTNFSMPTVTPTVTYSNGKLTITNTSTSGSAGGGSPSPFGRASASLSNIKVYLVIGDIKQPWFCL